MKNFDEALFLKFCIQRFVAGVDANRFESDEFGRCCDAEDVGVAYESQHIGRELEVASADQKALAPHRREQQQHAMVFVAAHVGTDDVEKTRFVEVAVKRVRVLNVDAQQGEIEVEVFSHASQGAAASPHDHQVGFVFQQGCHVVSQPLDGVFLADSLNLFLGTLHEPGRRRRPSFAVHANLPLTFCVHRFIQIHHFGDRRSKVADGERKDHLRCGFWSRCKAT